MDLKEKKISAIFGIKAILIQKYFFNSQVTKYNNKLITEVRIMIRFIENRESTFSEIIVSVKDL